MADNNLPTPGPVDAPVQSYDEQVEDLSNLLEAPETDHPGERADEAAADTKLEDDPLGFDVEAEDAETVDAEDPDDQPEIVGGRFAPDTAKVTLDDGTVITVSELKRNNLFQRGFTEKTQALAQERSSFETERQQVTEYAQSLNQSRDYLAWYAENFLPPAPQPFAGDPRSDPVGYLEWTASRDKWAAHTQAFQQFQQQQQHEEQQRSGETNRKAQAHLQVEFGHLLDRMPVLKDPARRQVTWKAMVDGAQKHYRMTEEEVSTIGDHRIVLALRDALAYHRIKAAAPQVQAKVAQKPAMNNGRRAATTAGVAKQRQARSERLRATGSLEDGIAALQDFDL